MIFNKPIKIRIYDFVEKKWMNGKIVGAKENGTLQIECSNGSKWNEGFEELQEKVAYQIT